MEIFIDIFNKILYQPLFNALVLVYQYIPGRDFGVAVIVLTILIRIVLYPLMVKSLKLQKEMAELQPKLQEIQNKHKDDKEKQAKALMELYQKEKVNPMGGCLPMLLQFPILIALYRVFWKGLDSSNMQYLYSFVPDPGVVDTTFLGVVNLGEASLIIALIAGAAQFVQTKMFIPKQKVQKTGNAGMFTDMLQKQMLYFFPLITVIILMKLPSAIGIYWITTSLFSIGQQYLILKKQNEPTKS